MDSRLGLPLRGCGPLKAFVTTFRLRIRRVFELAPIAGWLLGGAILRVFSLHHDTFQIKTARRFEERSRMLQHDRRIAVELVPEGSVSAVCACVRLVATCGDPFH